MLDYFKSRPSVVETNEVMTWDEFTFDADTYCHVNHYIFKCIDPNSVLLQKYERSTDPAVALISPISDSLDCGRFNFDKFDAT